MKRITYANCDIDVIDARLPGGDGKPLDAKVIRVLDQTSGELVDIPLAPDVVEGIIEGLQRKAAKPGESPSGLSIVKQMPSVLRRDPPPRSG